MSLTTGLIAIKGDHLNRLEVVFSAFRLVDTKNDELLTSWTEVEERMSEEAMNPQNDTQQRVVWFDNGWTIIEDLSLVCSADENALENISQELNTPVFSLITQGTSGSYGFWYFDKTKQRSFLNENGKVADNFGTPLPPEAKFKINEKAFYDDVHGVAKELGIDWEKAEKLNKFIVKRLANNEELNREVEQAMQKYKQQQAQKLSDKPWWKIW